MPMITRPARPADADAMCKILNRIIAIGGSTAHETPFDTARMTSHYIAPAEGIACTLAEEDGTVLGFQSLVRADGSDESLPPGWGVIASFVAPSAAGKGVGRALFAATEHAAREAGLQVIDATIRADNASGLGFYGKLGFRDYDRLEGVPLNSGRPVDRIRKRYDL